MATSSETFHWICSERFDMGCFREDVMTPFNPPNLDMAMSVLCMISICF